MFDSERASASFPRNELSHAIYGGPQQLEQFLGVQSTFDNDPILKWDPSLIQESRADIADAFAHKFLRVLELFPFNTKMQVDICLFWPIQIPLSLHFMMFLRTLNNLCDDEQAKVFLEPALKGEILGCYCQTELGHGSDVQSLMTEAVFDPVTDEFEIRTPDVRATKWWVGDLGLYCTHACVFAQLIVRKKNYGIHAFLVPIRDRTGKLVPGVEAGDIGPKLGFNNKDNGYAIFQGMRIPRRNMLMKYHRLSRDGTYEMKGDGKISYATMLIVRSLLPTVGFFNLSKAATILTRYSLVRRQFKDKNGVEVPILNYQLQQEKVIPRIAEAYATLMACKRLNQITESVVAEAKQGVFLRLNEAHVISSSMKAIISQDVLKGLETLRRAAGGHGFSMYSGVPLFLQEYASTYTLEGEYTVLQLQVARFLLKSFGNIQKGLALKDSVLYLHESAVDFSFDGKSCAEFRNPELLRRVFMYQSCAKVKKAALKMMSSGLPPKVAWDEHAGLELLDAAVAHSYFWMYQNFFEMIYQVTQNESVRSVLQKLLLLFGCEKIAERRSHFFETGTLTSNSLRCLEELRQDLLRELRPEALTLVEAFQYSDNTLTSALGVADGKPYEKMLEWVRHANKINQEPAKTRLR